MLPNVYFATYDGSMHIIPSCEWLWNKYYVSNTVDNKTPHLNYLGYKKPDFKIDSNFVSLKDKRESFKDWSINIKAYLDKIPDEFIVFTIDDNFLIDYANKDLISKAMEIMCNDSTIACCYGSFATSFNRDDRIYSHSSNRLDRVFEETEDYIIYEGSKSRYHLVNLQPNIWRKSVLCEILNNRFDIYDFEVTGSNIMRTSRYKFIGVEKKNAHSYRKSLFPNMYYTACSERRNPGKVSVLGMKTQDVEQLLSLKLLNTQALVYGYDKSYAIPYNEFSGKFNMILFEQKLKERSKIRNNRQLGDVVDNLDTFIDVLAPIYT